MFRLLLFFTVLIGPGILLAQSDSPKADFLQASVIHVEVGMDQFDQGFITAGLKYLKWDDIRFKSSNLYYGYNPWSSLHSIRAQFDYAMYFPAAGLSLQTVTDGKATNFSIRPQIGVFFIYANLYLGYNFWLASPYKDNLSTWTFSAFFSLPVKRW